MPPSGGSPAGEGGASDGAGGDGDAAEPGKPFEEGADPGVEGDDDAERGSPGEEGAEPDVEVPDADRCGNPCVDGDDADLRGRPDGDGATLRSWLGSRLWVVCAVSRNVILDGPLEPQPATIALISATTAMAASGRSVLLMVAPWCWNQGSILGSWVGSA